MRRVTLIVFFSLAACGGSGMSSSATPDLRSDAADRQAVVLSAQGQEVIATFARNHSEQAVDACLSEWLQDAAPADPREGPIQKPDVAGLRGFLAQCLAGSTTGDARNNRPELRGAMADQRANGLGSGF